ncbi:MAG TPA: heat-inducible transcriptional repressor HrcA [Chloroflexota bacterium]
MTLSERQEHILKTIVETYVSTARPVGSHAVVTASGLQVSSATVRNDVAILEVEGYVRQFHTSGGRIPTNAGYRYYVERLMGPNPLSTSEAVTIRHQFHQAHTELQEWLKLAATIMAYRMHNVALVTAPKSAEVRLRHVEIISTQPLMALLIVVLQDGTVLQEMMAFPEPRNQEDLSAIADRLSTDLRGLAASEIEARATVLPDSAAAMAAMISHLVKRGTEQHTQLYHAGLADMIRQPEFLGPRPGESMTMLNDRLRQMVEFLQQGFAVQRLLAGLPQASDVHIVIGSDMGSDGLQDYSFVLGRYGLEDESSGYLGIVGPTRMEYRRAVALVRYMSELMTDLVQAY